MWDLLKHKNKIAFLTDDSTQNISYQGLVDFSHEFSKKVCPRALGIILCSNTIGSVAGYISCIQNRIVPLLLPSDISLDLLQNFISIYKPSFLWIPDNIAIYENALIKFKQFGYTLKGLSQNENNLYKDLALLLTTSGSTGSPKLVRLSYANVKSNAVSISKYLNLNSEERPITTLPMNYSYGLSVINSHLEVGATILLTNKSIFDRGFWSFLKGEKATSIAGVPYTYEMLERLRFLRMELPYLKTLTQAGGKLSESLHLKFADYASKTGKKFFVMYGQSEATARISYLPYERCLEKVGSVGIAIPGGNVKIQIDEISTENTKTRSGELVYTGDNVSLGYATSLKDLEKGDDNKGILHTGDIARLDNDGYIYIIGRKKRFLKVFGNRVNLDEIECLIKSRFNDIECACTGTDDLLKIYLTDQKFSDEVKYYLADITKLNFSAFNVIIIDKIPSSDSGKTLYSLLS